MKPFHRRRTRLVDAGIPRQEARATLDAERDHWSECGRATAVAGLDALCRPHRSVLALAQTWLPAAQAYRDLVFRQWWTRWTGSTDASGKCTARASYGKHRITAGARETVVDLHSTEGRVNVKF